MTRKRSFLVADIGGTNARFAIAKGRETNGYSLTHVRYFKNKHFETLRDAALVYLQDIDGDTPERACFAVAGPVKHNTIQLTNSTWNVQAETLTKELGLKRLLVVNDFAAQARGAVLLAPSNMAHIHSGTGQADAPRIVLGPGTGLGMGILVPMAEGFTVLSTEAGHAGFAPRNKDEFSVARILADEYGFISWEHILSGQGLINLHRALCVLSDMPYNQLRSEEITACALAESGSMCRKAVDMFCAALGSFAGDAAVIIGARGGVFLSGGILPSVRHILKTSDFNARFEVRGQLSHYTKTIPVFLVLSDTAPLLGAAALAEERDP